MLSVFFTANLGRMHVLYNSHDAFTASLPASPLACAYAQKGRDKAFPDSRQQSNLSLHAASISRMSALMRPVACGGAVRHRASPWLNRSASPIGPKEENCLILSSHGSCLAGYRCRQSGHDTSRKGRGRMFLPRPCYVQCLRPCLRKPVLSHSHEHPVSR